MDPSLPLALPVPGMASTAPKSTKSKTQGKEGAILVPSTNIPPNASAPKSSGPEFALKRRQTFRDPEGKHGDLVSNLAEDDSEEEDDPTERYRSLLQLFDTHKAWKPAEPGEDWYAAVTKFLARHPKLCKRLDETDDEGKTLLHMIVTQPRRRKNALSNLKPFDRRRDFFKWVMREVPELYKTMDEGTGSTVLSLATNRVGRPMIKEELKNESREFIEFFVELYPKETAELLKDVDVDNSKMKQLQLHLVHELLPILQDRRSNLSRSLLGYLDKNTIMNRDRDGNTVLHLASRYHFMCDESPESHKELRQGIKKLLEVCPEALTSLNYARESPYQYRVSTYKAYSKSKSEIVDSAKLPLPDDSIAQLLKDKYMHLLQRDETIKYLHGDVQGRPGLLVYASFLRANS